MLQTGKWPKYRLISSQLEGISRQKASYTASNARMKEAEGQQPKQKLDINSQDILYKKERDYRGVPPPKTGKKKKVKYSTGQYWTWLFYCIFKIGLY